MPEINVKDILIRRIDSKSANNFVKKWHYSGKVVNNSQLHFGAFYDGKLHGVLSYGASMNQRATANIVAGTGINEFTELNRMAFDDFLPKNSESRCIAISIRLIKKNCPHIKWILSYADGTQCGDGTIYRASGFVLTNIGKNSTIGVSQKTGEIVAKHGLMKDKHGKVELLPGYQLRYIYFIDKDKMKDLTVPLLAFSEIEKAGAKMYKGISG